MRPELPPLFSEAGPTGVQTWWDNALLLSIVKMRKLAVAWSALNSPKPVPATDLGRVSDHGGSPGFFPTRVAVLVAEALLIWSVHVPVGEVEPLPIRRLRGSCGLKLPLNGGKPWLIGVLALS